MMKILKELIGYYKPYKLLFYLDMLFAMVGAAVTLVIPLVVRYITTTVIYYDTSVAQMVILQLGALMLVLVVIEFICNYYIAYWGHIMGARMEADMRAEIFGHYQKLSFTFFDDQKVGHLLSRVTTDLFDISEVLHHGPEDLIISIIKILGSFIILSLIDIKLAVVAFIFVPIMAVYAGILNRRMTSAFKRNRAKIANINSQIEDSLSGIRVVKSFANEEVEIEKFQEGNKEFLKAKRKSYLYMGAYHSGMNALSTMITVVVLVVGFGFITDGKLEVVDLITFLLYISNFIEPVKKLVNFTEQFQNGYSGYVRFKEIMEIAPDIKDKEDAINIDKLEGNIVFDQVAFGYNNQTEKVLCNIDLDVKAGEYMALVGPSGAGKTTLCSLIARFYDATSGSIRIDDIDIRDMKLDALRNNVGIVQQDVYLFVGTILENIRYGKPGATDEEVVTAAKQANAHDFIMGLQDGYNTDIGQRGVKLSGGQKQRLSIARVFLKNPPILIFDEATSALDNESELVVQQSLESLAKNRTTFVIAHRLSTIRNAERILVLTDEGIVEQGSHKELMDLEGVYSALYQVQFK
ncbi:MAG: ABC transporter ATP-binding protein [Eubacteriales bacterium]